MFNQTFNKVGKVKNFDNSKAATPTENYRQTFEEVEVVENIVYAREQDKEVLELCSLIEKMDELQTQKFIEQINTKASSAESADYKPLQNTIKEKHNLKQCIIEYVKSGTAVISFVNSLLLLAKAIIGV